MSTEKLKPETATVRIWRPRGEMYRAVTLAYNPVDAGILSVGLAFCSPVDRERNRFSRPQGRRIALGRLCAAERWYDGLGRRPKRRSTNQSKWGLIPEGALDGLKTLLSGYGALNDWHLAMQRMWLEGGPEACLNRPGLAISHFLRMAGWSVLSPVPAPPEPEPYCLSLDAECGLWRVSVSVQEEGYTFQLAHSATLRARGMHYARRDCDHGAPDDAGHDYRPAARGLVVALAARRLAAVLTEWYTESIGGTVATGAVEHAPHGRACPGKMRIAKEVQ